MNLLMDILFPWGMVFAFMVWCTYANKGGLQ